MSTSSQLGVGLIGSGFNARFHMQAFRAVRDADVLGVWSPNPKNAAAAAALARTLDVGEAKAYASIADMVADPAIDAIWLTGPNHARIENVEEIVDAIESGRGTLRGIACEKPLARNVAEAKRVMRARQAGRHDARLSREPGVRAAGRSGPRADLGARRRDDRPALPRARRRGAQRTAHAVVLARRAAGRRRAQRHDVPLGARRAASADQAGRRRYRRREARARHGAHRESQVDAAASTRSSSAKTMGTDVDYAKRPSEDFASVTIEFETDDGHTVIGEATTSWSFVGAGLRLSAELLGPRVLDVVEHARQRAQAVLQPRSAGQGGRGSGREAERRVGFDAGRRQRGGAYGYEAEDRHFVRAFLGKEEPQLTFDDGLEVVRLLMTAYQSAEQGRTLAYPPPGLDDFVPAVAQGKWRPRA